MSFHSSLKIRGNIIFSAIAGRRVSATTTTGLWCMNGVEQWETGIRPRAVPFTFYPSDVTVHWLAIFELVPLSSAFPFFDVGTNND